MGNQMRRQRTAKGEQFINNSNSLNNKNIYKEKNQKQDTFRFDANNLKLLKALASTLSLTGEKISQNELINEALEMLLQSKKYKSAVETTKQILSITNNSNQ